MPICWFPSIVLFIRHGRTGQGLLFLETMQELCWKPRQYNPVNCNIFALSRCSEGNKFQHIFSVSPVKFPSSAETLRSWFDVQQIHYLHKLYRTSVYRKKESKRWPFICFNSLTLRSMVAPPSQSRNSSSSNKPEPRRRSAAALGFFG